MTTEIQLENWFVAVDTPTSLCGDATGHPKKPEPHFITTSRVVGRIGDVILTKSGSRYKLGNPKADYEETFPNARQRLLTTIPEVQ